MRVLALLGSLRRDSHNAALVRAAADLLPPGATLVSWHGLKAIPPFDEDDEPAPAREVEDLRAAVRAAGALLVVTPEYNGSLPGQLKNALDWLSRPFATNPVRGKTVAVVGGSSGMFGGVWSQADARRVLGLMGARVLDLELAVPQIQHSVDAGGALRNPELSGRLQRLLAELVGQASDLPKAA